MFETSSAPTDTTYFNGQKGITTSDAQLRQALAPPPAGADGTPASTGALGSSSPALASGIPEYPDTLTRPPPNGLDKYIPQPAMPRATRAISKEHPEGSPNSNDKMTVLQQHVAFWDRDHDGVIWPSDTYVGFRRLGFGYLISAMAVPVIHGTFSYPTQKSWIPHPGMPIYLDRMHRTKHGSDSETFDTEGRFVPDKFEAIFSKFDKENKGGLSWDNVQDMVYNNMNVMDWTGWIAERLEWWVTYLLLKDENGVVSKEKIRGVYDGTIWEVVATQMEAEKQRKQEAKRAARGFKQD